MTHRVVRRRVFNEGLSIFSSRITLIIKVLPEASWPRQYNIYHIYIYIYVGYASPGNWSLK